MILNFRDHREKIKKIIIPPVWSEDLLYFLDLKGLDENCTYNEEIKELKIICFGFVYYFREGKLSKKKSISPDIQDVSIEFEF